MADYLFYLENYVYIRAMFKKVLFILSLLLLFVIDQKIGNQEDNISSSSILEYIQENRGLPETLQEHFEYETQNQSLCVSLFLTNRFQLTQECGERFVKVVSRQFETLVQKGQNVQIRTTETLLILHSLNISSLRIRSGHWIYVLRKIII